MKENLPRSGLLEPKHSADVVIVGGADAASSLAPSADAGRYVSNHKK